MNEPMHIIMYLAITLQLNQVILKEVNNTYIMLCVKQGQDKFIGPWYE